MAEIADENIDESEDLNFTQPVARRSNRRCATVTFLICPALLTFIFWILLFQIDTIVAAEILKYVFGSFIFFPLSYALYSLLLLLGGIIAVRRSDRVAAIVSRNVSIAGLLINLPIYLLITLIQVPIAYFGWWASFVVDTCPGDWQCEWILVSLFVSALISSANNYFAWFLRSSNEIDRLPLVGNRDNFVTFMENGVEVTWQVIYLNGFVRIVFKKPNRNRNWMLTFPAEGFGSIFSITKQLFGAIYL